MALVGIGLIGLAAYSTRSLPGSGDKPEENRFTKVVLAEKLNEPLEMAILPDERVLLIERHGAVRLYSPTTKQLSTIATIPVSTKYIDKEGNETEAEDGLLGVNIDPNFAQNHWVYFYYSPPGTEPKNILTRYELNGDELVLNSKKVILEVPTQREQCCHTGGSIDWDRAGNLYLSTGDNTSPRATLYAPIDEREGRGPWDAQKSSGNTNDLRGKILRIHPEADGTYTIPEGNLFPKETDPSDRPRTRPEIYTMGHRNPYRISVDKHTGYVYWGDVGPDAGVDSANVGPTAEDEYNVARQAGNFGWPYFVGDNKAYYDVDFATNKTGAKFDPAHPVNDSPNNTGLRDLPPAQPALLSYPAAESKKFPIMGSGGRSAMAGPAYYKDDFTGAKRPDAARPFPDYYNGKVFLYEWMRDMILAASVNDKGEMTNVERFLPNMAFSHPIDMAFGPNGDLYVLEYGTGWFVQNDDSRLVRIEFNAGNRKPVVQASASQTAGAIPMKVAFSAEGTKDFDGDALTYQWKLFAKAGGQPTVLDGANPMFTFRKPGQYKAILTVRDDKGLADSREVAIVAGNQPPVVTLDITKGNKSFYFPNQPIAYQVSVTDKEDGSLVTSSATLGKIQPKQVVVRSSYQDEASAQPTRESGHKFTEAAYLGAGKTLMDKSDCKSCHFVDKKSVGPAFADVSRRYKGDANAVASLSNKIIKGGGGVWGDAIMTAHPQISASDAQEMVKYILTLSDKPAVAPALPTKGTVMPDKEQKGNLVLRASYKDKGANGLPPQTSEQVLVLRNSTLALGVNDGQSKGTMNYKMGQSPIVIVLASDTYVQYNRLDLTGIRGMEFAVAIPKQQLSAVGGRIEVRLDSPTGQLLGQTEELLPVEIKKEAQSPADVFKPTLAKIPLRPVTGVHDLYFVFKNEKAGKSPLFVPVSVQLFN